MKLQRRISWGLRLLILLTIPSLIVVMTGAGHRPAGEDGPHTQGTEPARVEPNSPVVAVGDS